MEFEIIINNYPLKVSKGDTILTAARKNGIKIPVLCNWPELSPTGACRLCVVEIKGTPDLVPACSTPVSEGMIIQTHSLKVIKARKNLVSLLLANHPEDCLYCAQNGSCELQDIANSLNIRERYFTDKYKDQKTDRTDPSMILDMTKCILCGRCVRICKEIAKVSALEFIGRGKNMKVEPVFKKGLYYSPCIHCGKCIVACPTAAISEKSVLNQISEKIDSSDNLCSISLSPSTIAWFSANYNIKKYEDTKAFLVAALIHVGFKTVNTNSFGIEVFISEETKKVQTRLDDFKIPYIITDCPAAKTFIKNHVPDLKQFLCKIYTPQYITGTNIKKQSEANTIHTAVAPCVSLKHAAANDYLDSNSKPTCDFVISSLELDKLLRSYGISLPYANKEIASTFSAYDTSSGALFETKGGISETILRNLFAINNENQKTPKKIFDNRSDKDFMEYEFQLNNKTYKIASINGTDCLLENKEVILNSNYLFIEFRSCKHACISGCGNSLKNDFDLWKKLKKVISDYDDANHNSNVSQNQFIKGLYKENKNEDLI